MMIFRVFRKTTLLAGAFVLGVMPAGAETLTDALVAAYRNSNLLEQNRALLRVADENVAQTVAGLKPILSYISSAQATSPKTGRNRVVVSHSGDAGECALARGKPEVHMFPIEKDA